MFLNPFLMQHGLNIGDSELITNVFKPMLLQTPDTLTLMIHTQIHIKNSRIYGFFLLIDTPLETALICYVFPKTRRKDF